MTETICIFSALYDPHIGGVENYTKAISEELALRGYRVVIVTNNHADLPNKETPSDNLTIYRLPCYPLLNARLPLPKKNTEFKTLMHEIEALPIDHLCINTRFYPHSLIGARLAQNKGLTPIVIDHGSDYLVLGNPLIDPVIKRYEHIVTNKIKKSNPHFYAVSHRGSEWLKTFGIESQGEIHNAINAEEFLSKDSGRNFRAELEIPDDDIAISFVGRLNPEKGIIPLMEAAQMLQGQKGLHFLIAGDGPLRSELETTAPNNMHFLGALTQPDVVALLKTADIFCLPSRSEGFATVLLEAASCSAAPIITNVGGVDELIPNESYGIVLRDQDSETIATAIRSLCENREQLVNIASNINNLVKSNYNWQETADALLTAFATTAQ